MLKKYLTMNQFAEATGYRKQSIYNMVSKKMLIVNVHYRKPSTHKLLFYVETVESLVSGEIHRAYSKRVKKSPSKPDGSVSLSKSCDESGKHLPGSTRRSVIKIGPLRARLKGLLAS